MKKFTKLCLFVAAILFATTAFSQEDLSIIYMQRLPVMEYVENSSNPAVEGWPSVGQSVTWSAKVKHWGTSTVIVNYRWYVDGVEVGAGSREIFGGTEIDINYIQNWTFDRKELKLVVDSENYFAETEEGNNEITVFTDAISVGFYVEQGVYDYFHEHQKKLGVGSNSFEDWAHRQVSIWNNMLEDAVFPGVPNGVLDRIRLDKITIVPNEALPLPGGGLATNRPANDKTVDLIWGFPTDYLDDGYFNNHTDAVTTNPFYYDGPLLHELGHARYLVDAYGFNIESEGGQTIDIREDGVDIDESGLFPSPFHIDMLGLMHAQYDFIDEYSALALNLIAGHRAVCGNANPPCNLGDREGQFMQDLPTQNRILITDTNGLPVPNANVQIYQSERGSTVWYGKRYDDTPDLTFTSDGSGYVYVGRNPFSDGRIEHTYPYSNSMVIIRAGKNGIAGYNAIGSWQFNMQYWRGNGNLGTYELAFDNIVGGGTTPPVSVCDLVATNSNYEFIQSVEIGSATNNSGNDGGYGDYTALNPMSVSNGTTVTLTPGFSSSSYQESWKIWIDLNKDGDFADSGEEVFSGSGNIAVSGTLNLPGGVSGTTIMRVAMQWNNAPPSCGSYTYGEVEDYTVNLNDDQTEPQPVPVCDLAATNSSYEFIQSVQIGGTSNDSGNDGGYGDYTALNPMNVSNGTVVTLTPGFLSGSYIESWKIWIDLNRDGDFEDAGEEVFAGSGNSAVSGALNLPGDVSGTAIMRVAMQWNNAPPSCGSYTYGEVEDYTVALSGSGSKLASAVHTIQVYPNPARGHINIDIDDLLFTDNPESLTATIYTMDGKKVYSEQLNIANTITINTEHLNKAVYLIRLRTEDGRTYVGRFVKL